MLIFIFYSTFQDLDTWIRVGIWSIIGFGIYFGYGIHHSVLIYQQQHKHQTDQVQINKPAETDALVHQPVRLE